MKPNPQTMLSKRPKLVLLISTLAMGGAERVVSLLADGWSKQKIDLAVVTFADPDSDFYPLPENVQRVSLKLQGPSNNIHQAITTNLKRLMTLRRTFRQLRPDAIISHLDAMNVLAVIAAAGLSIPVVATEHTNLEEYQEHLPLPWRILRRFTYKRTAAVVAVSNNTLNQLACFVPQRLLQVIPNPADPAGCQGKPSLNIEGPAIVSMGRLVESKGIDMLIKAFALSIKKNPAWSLLILGDGPERNKLESYAKELGVGEKCIFSGAINNPGPTLAQAEIFALASRYEGFPMSLVEAMVCGLPVVCTKYSPDTGEIVSDGVDGILVDVDDVAGLTAALNQLMSNDDLRNQMSLKAKELTERFSLESVLNQWNDLLTEICGRPWPGQ